MSQVTNAIITCSVLDEEVIPRVNEFFEGDVLGFGWFHGDERSGTFDCERCVGGYKALECCMGVGAFNYLDEAGLIAFVRSLPWQEPDDVQLFVQRQWDGTFSEVLHAPAEPT